MSHSKGLRVLIAFLACSTLASAQFTITNIVNAASRQNTGIAQGSLFAVSGRGIGPADIQQATFPLPTTDGLGGVTIQANVEGQIVDCIMVYVKPNEVGAILPSNTPIGSGTLTVNNNGASASRAINVLASAFGIFTLNYGFAAGRAVAFNANADGSMAVNRADQSVQAGQDVLINGTGLGAIPSDETQPGVADAPGTDVKVYVGMLPATVVSAGRGSCCDGLADGYLVPRGIAAWDVIRFTVPDGVVGCNIPVVVQIGTSVSNLAVISIDPGGAACTPAPSTVPPELVDQLSTQTGISLGSVSLSRGYGISEAANGRITTTEKDTGGASFVRYADAPASIFAPYSIYAENVCTIDGFPDINGNYTQDGNTIPIVPLKATLVDAGTPITVKGPAGSKNIVKRTVGMVFDYPGVTFGDGSPGNYFDAGTYYVTSAGGKDVGKIDTSIDVPSEQFEWTNRPSPADPIDRSTDITITWSGGVVGTQVYVMGNSFVAGVNHAFRCVAPIAAGQMTIPSWVLLSLPATGNSIVPGQLTVGDESDVVFTPPGLDFATLRYGVTFVLNLKYQ